jgi:hypothetical protein
METLKTESEEAYAAGPLCLMLCMFSSATLEEGSNWQPL